MWPNPQETADLVTLAEDIRIGKLHFLCSVVSWVGGDRGPKTEKKIPKRQLSRKSDDWKKEFFCIIWHLSENGNFLRQDLRGIKKTN